MIPTHLLYVLLLCSIAHAAPLEISLHSENTSTDSSIVSNWTLICEDLCSLNISALVCSINCSKNPVDEHLASTENHLSDEFCEILCENGLGENRCACPVAIVPAQFFEASHKPDSSKFCFYFCHYQHVTLKGCPRCVFEEQSSCERHFPLTIFDRPPLQHIPMHPPPPPIILLPPPHPIPTRPLQVNSFELHQQQKPIFPISRLDSIPPGSRPNSMSQSLSMHQQDQIQTSTDSSSTPDWNRLCIQLCRNGNGGILCNCDLPPF